MFGVSGWGLGAKHQGRLWLAHAAKGGAPMTSRACWQGNVTQEGLVRALASAANTLTACGEGWAHGSADTLPLPGWDAPPPHAICTYTVQLGGDQGRLIEVEELAPGKSNSALAGGRAPVRLLRAACCAAGATRCRPYRRLDMAPASAAGAWRHLPWLAWRRCGLGRSVSGC